MVVYLLRSNGSNKYVWVRQFQLCSLEGAFRKLMKLYESNPCRLKAAPFSVLQETVNVSRVKKQTHQRRTTFMLTDLNPFVIKTLR